MTWAHHDRRRKNITLIWINPQERRNGLLRSVRRIRLHVFSFTSHFSPSHFSLLIANRNWFSGSQRPQKEGNVRSARRCTRRWRWVWWSSRYLYRSLPTSVDLLLDYSQASGTRAQRGAAGAQARAEQEFYRSGGGEGFERFWAEMHRMKGDEWMVRTHFYPFLVSWHVDETAPSSWAGVWKKRRTKAASEMEYIYRIR